MRALVCFLAFAALGCDGFQSRHRTPGNGMAPTLLAGDWFVVDRVGYVFGDPARGDVVLFSREGEHFVQRVVGVPGDSIDVRGSRLTLNGEVLPLEPTGSALDVEPPATRGWGTLPRERILGQARWIYFSWDEQASRVRWDRIGDTIE